MRISMRLDALEKAREHAEIALAEWRKYMILKDIPEPDANNDDLSRFISELDRNEKDENTRLTSLQFKFATNPVLRATFFDPNNRQPTEDSYIIRPPDRDIDEPHIFEETWECVRRYLQGDDCVVDEDFDVYVISKRKPHRIVHVIRSCRKDKKEDS